MKFRSLALSLLVCALAAGQTIQLMPMPKQQFFDSNGYPLAGGFLFTYAAGTTTPLVSYTDSTGGSANANPVVLDAGGFASVWLDGTVKYHVVLQNSSHVQIYSADNISSTGGGYVAAVTAAGGDYALQYALSGGFAGDNTRATFNPSTNKLSAPLFAGDGSCITGQGAIYAACYGVSPANAANDTQLAAAMTAAYNLASPGNATPANVILPCGTLGVNGPVSLPPLVHVWGCGRGDSKQLVGPNGNGSVIQANSTFSALTFPNNAVVIMGGNGASSQEYFDSQLHNLEIDAANVAGTGWLIANCQEQCSADHVIVNNIVSYGIFEWGANNNGNSGGVNGYWGLPANYQGGANDGPYTNIEIYGNAGVSASTVPLVVNNEAGLRGFIGLSVVMVPDNQEGGVHTPNTCGMISGGSFLFESVHCEGPRDGFIFGPYANFGDSAQSMVVNNVQYSSSTASGCTVHLENVKGITVGGARGPSGHVLCDDSGTYAGNDSWYVSENRQSTNFTSTMGTARGYNVDSPITTSSNVKASQLQGGSMLLESTGPCYTLQMVETTPLVFPYQNICVNTTGDIIHTFSGALPGGGTPVSGTNGDEYWQGEQSLVLGVGLNKSGLNMSAPGGAPTAATDNIMTVLGNALSWDLLTGDFLVAYNGHADANGWIGGLDGMSFVGSNSASAGHFSDATVLGWTSAHFLNNGTQTLGNSGVSGAVTTILNSAGSCTLTPPSSWSCTSDARKKRDINYSSSAMGNAMDYLLRLKPASFNMLTDAAGAPARFGFIAQDVQKVLPGLVTTAADGTLSLDTGGMVPYLVSAVQQLQTQVNALRAELQARPAAAKPVH